MKRERKEKRATNPAKASRLYDEIQKRFAKREYFTPANLTHDSVCGFKLVETLRPFLEQLVEQGLLEKGDGKSRFSLNKKHKSYEEAVINNDTKELEENMFNEDVLPSMGDIRDVVKNYKRFVITTAVSKKRVDLNYLKSIKNYAKRNNAAILILPSDIGNSNRSGKSIMEFDKALKGCHIVYKDLYLNKNLCICSIKTSAKQIKTLTGLDRIATKKQASIIVASTKPFMNYVPNRISETPFAVMSTGAITQNNYDTDLYMSKRTSYLAEEDHELGAVIIEIEDEKFFHFRHSQATERGTFTDLGVEYWPDGSVKELANTTSILGDLHVEQLNKDLYPYLVNFITKMSIETLVLHDVFNSTSITHHDKGKLLTRAMKANDARNSLKAEGYEVASCLSDLKAHVNNVVIVNSNHDRHLESYLEEGRFMTDPINTELGLELSLAYIRGKNPLKYLIEEIVGYKDNNIKWLRQDESFVKYGVELGSHGDAGANGAKASLVSFERGIGNCVTAHTHSAQILRKAYCVGTVSKLVQDYNSKGLSSWTITCCLVYSNGVKQLINFIPNKQNEYKFTTSL